MRFCKDSWELTRTSPYRDWADVVRKACSVSSLPTSFLQRSLGARVATMRLQYEGRTNVQLLHYLCTAFARCSSQFVRLLRDYSPKYVRCPWWDCEICLWHAYGLRSFFGLTTLDICITLYRGSWARESVPNSHGGRMSTYGGWEKIGIRDTDARDTLSSNAYYANWLCNLFADCFIYICQES